MAFDIPINFRATAGYVTDSGVETYSLGETYPTSRGGFTFGWSPSTPNIRDRNSAIDRRLAGMHFVANGAGTSDFRIDLPSSGAVALHLALGDASSGQTEYVEILDNITSLGFIVNGVSTSGSNRWFDATGTEYTEVTWPTTETGISLIFASTICIIRCGIAVGGGSTCIAHARVVQTAAINTLFAQSIF